MSRSLFGRVKLMWWLLSILILAGLTLSCGERSTKSEGGAVVITSLVIVPASVQEGRSAVVDLAVVDDGGQPLSGVEVSFSVSPSNIGNCSPAVDTTDANGSAGTVFTGVNPGAAVIRAGIQGVTSRTVQVEVVTPAVSTDDTAIATPGMNARRLAWNSRPSYSLKRASFTAVIAP